MSDLLATGRIDIDLNDKDAVAGLRALDTQFDRTMSSIERKKAEVQIEGNLTDLKKTIKEAEARVKAHNKKLKQLEKYAMCYRFLHFFAVRRILFLQSLKLAKLLMPRKGNSCPHGI